MLYKRSQQIEARFGKILELISKKSLNSRQLAMELGISQPTVQRIITELRRRGYKVRAVHDESGWRYELNNRN